MVCTYLERQDVIRRRRLLVINPARPTIYKASVRRLRNHVSPAGSLNRGTSYPLRLTRVLACVLIFPLAVACSSPGSSNNGDGDLAPETLSVEEQVADLADSLNITDPPAVETVRLVTPEERGPLVDACLAEQGYSSLDLLEVGIPEEQLGAFELAQFICMAKYPIDPEYTSPWSEDQISIQYDWTIDSVIPCLVDRGYTITDVPSREVFISTWFSDPFYPFSQIPPSVLSNEQSDALNQACPQIAPTELLWSQPPD